MVTEQEKIMKAVERECDKYIPHFKRNICFRDGAQLLAPLLAEFVNAISPGICCSEACEECNEINQALAKYQEFVGGGE